MRAIDGLLSTYVAWIPSVSFPESSIRQWQSHDLTFLGQR